MPSCGLGTSEEKHDGHTVCKVDLFTDICAKKHDNKMNHDVCEQNSQHLKGLAAMGNHLLNAHPDGTYACMWNNDHNSCEYGVQIGDVGGHGSHAPSHKQPRVKPKSHIESGWQKSQDETHALDQRINAMKDMF